MHLALLIELTILWTAVGIFLLLLWSNNFLYALTILWNIHSDWTYVFYIKQKNWFKSIRWSDQRWLQMLRMKNENFSFERFNAKIIKPILMRNEKRQTFDATRIIRAYEKITLEDAMSMATNKESIRHKAVARIRRYPSRTTNSIICFVRHAIIIAWCTHCVCCSLTTILFDSLFMKDQGENIVG